MFDPRCGSSTPSRPVARGFVRWPFIATAALLAGLAGGVFTAPAASAADESTGSELAAPTPSPTPSESPTEIPRPSTPDIPRPGAPVETPGDDTGVNLTVDPFGSRVSLPLTLSGTRSAGAEVQVQVADGTGQPLCISPAADTAWSCSIDSLPSGSAVPIRVVALSGGSTTEETISVAWLAAPTITASEAATTSGHVGGTAYPGATVTAGVAGGSSACTTNADDSGVWSCVLGEPLSSGSYSVSATQRTDFYGVSASSDTVAVLIDRDAPGSPSIASPTTGVQLPTGTVQVVGTGEEGSTVLVFAGIRLLCQSLVTDGVWSCSGALSDEGRVELTAVQRDAAGNLGVAGAAVAVRVSAAQGTPTPSPGTSTREPGGAGQSSAHGDAAAPGPTAGEPSGPPMAGESGASGAGRPTETSWTLGLRSPTAFGTVLAPLTSAVGAGLVTAAGLSAGTIGLALLPGIAGLRTLRSRIAPLPAVTGRNRWAVDRVRDVRSAPANPWMVGAATLIAATVVAVLSGPVLAQPSYLRLGAAILIGLALVNAVGTAAVVGVARRAFGVNAAIVVRPGLLGIAAIAAALTRLFGLTPPLAFGQILGVRFDRSVGTGVRANIAVARTASLCVIAIVAWFAYSLLDPAATAGLLFANELAATVTFAAAGSAAISLVPVAGSAGTDLLARSRRLWAVSAFAAWTVLFTILTSTLAAQGASGVVSAAIAAAAFGAVGASIWLWARFVEPALRD